MRVDDFATKKELRRILAKEKSGPRCSYPLCQAKAHSRGMCSTHYARWTSMEHHRVRLSGPEGNAPVHMYKAVYAIGCEESIPVKIGRATNIMQRKAAMQVGCPWPLRVYGAMILPGPAAIWLETETHRVLTEMGYRLHGEWFVIPKEDAQRILEKVCKIHGIPGLRPLSAIDAAISAEFSDGMAHRDFVRWVGLVANEVLDGYELPE